MLTTALQGVEASPELLAYEARLPELLAQHTGQYVVIHGDEPLQFFDSYSAALTWAYDRFGVHPFFVKQVKPDPAIAHYTRDLGPCRR